MSIFQILFVPLCTGMALLVMLRTMRGGISRRQGVLGAVLWLTAAALIAAPKATVVLAGWLGIGRGSDLVFYLGLIAGLVGFLHFHNRYRTLEIRVTELLRRDAIQHPEHGGECLDAHGTFSEPEHDSL